MGQLSSRACAECAGVADHRGDRRFGLRSWMIDWVNVTMHLLDGHEGLVVMTELISLILCDLLGKLLSILKDRGSQAPVALTASRRVCGTIIDFKYSRYFLVLELAELLLNTRMQFPCVFVGKLCSA